MFARPARRFVGFRLLILCSLLLTLLPATVAARAAPSGSNATSATAAQSNERNIYIVVQTAPPVALYQGGVAGLAPTNPEALGEVKLDADSAASQAYRDYLRAERGALLGVLAAALGHEIEAVNHYDWAINGFSARLTPGEAATVRATPGIAFVVENEILETLTDTGPAWMNADEVWDGTVGAGPGNKGEGIVAGIIDTGVNPAHPSFAAIGPVDGYVHQNPRGRFYGVCASEPASDTQCNNKLIGLYDFVGSGVADDNGHGSHTASTVAGNVVDATLVAPTTTLSSRRISGVAPHANVISYKACQTAALPVVGACPINAIVAAIDAATADVPDVVNFSIGGGSVDPWQDPLGLSFFGAHAAGVFVAASAGNNGPNPGTIGRPSNSPWLMSVGASTHNRRPTGTVTATKSNGDQLQITGTSLTSGLGPLALVDAKALGNELCNPFTTAQQAQIAGKIVICTQGVIGRVQKGINAQAGGAAGMILVSQAGYRNSVVSDTHVIPTVMIGQWDGRDLRSWLAGATAPEATLAGVDIQVNSDLADRMAGFSSRGPDANLRDVIKPDVTAPGVSILAAWKNDTARNGDDYEMIQGTSMSSPHAAGAGALVAAVHPNWTPDQIKSALMSTAFTVPAGGKEIVPVTREDHTTPANPHDFGGGRIDVAAAARAGFTLDESVASYLAANPAVGGQARSLNLASFANGNCKPSCTWTRTLTSTAATPITYTVTTTDGPGFDLSASPSSLTLPAGATATITVTATNTGLGAVAWQYGEVRFTPGGGGTVQTFPVAVKETRAPTAPDCEVPETVVGTDGADQATPELDLREVAVAGVYPNLDGDEYPHIRFRLKIESLETLPPSTGWWVWFTPPDGVARWVSMNTYTPGEVKFQYGNQTSAGIATLGPVDAGSYTTDGTITISLATSKIGFVETGDVISNVNGQVRQFAGAQGAAGLYLPAVDSTPPANYKLVDCSYVPPPPPPPPPPAGGDNRTVLYMQGNLDEECSGIGQADLLVCGGPFLTTSSTLDANPSARWVVMSAVNQDIDQSPYDPSWLWDVSERTTLAGQMTVEWWANCNGCVIPAVWEFQLFADGAPVFAQDVTIEQTLVLPARLRATVTLPRVSASDTFVLQVDPQYLDIQEGTVVLYDGQLGCGSEADEACNSLVRVPVVAPLNACREAPFTDVAVDHPFCKEINAVKTIGITTGFADRTFRPSLNVTRQAMAAFLARMAGATPAACTGAPFSDVPVDHPFCKEINWLKTEGITTGFGDGTFRPGLNVTRMAMAAFLTRVADADPAACTSAPFTDVSVDHPFCAEIDWLKTSGITTGFSDGTFRPELNVTRQAMAAFLYRGWVLLG